MNTFRVTYLFFLVSIWSAPLFGGSLSNSNFLKVMSGSYFQQQLPPELHEFRGDEKCCTFDDPQDEGMCLLFKALRLEDGGEGGGSINLLKKSSKLGNTYATVKLAELKLFSGGGENLDEAISLYRVAAERSNAIAKFALAQIYLNVRDSVGVEEPELRSMVVESAESDFLPSISLLGRLYIEGALGVTRDKAKGREYLSAAADRGYPPAQFALGLHQLSVRDIKAGIRNLRRSANNGYSPAHYELAQYYLSEDSEVMAIDERNRLAIEHLRKAYEANIPGSAIKLGMAYVTGRGVPKDYSKAIGFFEEAVGHSGGEAEAYLGELYYRGLGVQKDVEQACAYFRESADAEYPDGIFGYGICLLRAENDEKTATAIELIRRAERLGSSRAVRFLKRHGDSPWFEGS